MRGLALNTTAFWILFFCSGGCRAPVPVADPQAAPGPQAGTQTLALALQELVDEVAKASPVTNGVALHVDSPQLGLVWSGAAGLADPAAGNAMTPDHPVRIASNTKTFVAATVLRLWEEGRLDLDDPVARRLSDQHLHLLRDDGYDPEAITVRHLLTHTGGLFDHTESDNFVQKILAAPQHRWTRSAQVQAAMEWGEPWGQPGEFFHYSDTGYALLGEIIERASQMSLPKAVRRLLAFERLGLDSTWFETLEPRPDAALERAHQFFGERDVTAFDPSFDLYGGGGIASTVGDLARFYRALFTDGVFARSATRDVMLTTVAGVRSSPGATASHLSPGSYRMGIWATDVAGYATYRHSGFFGTLATYVPALDLTVTMTVNRNASKAALESLTRGVVCLVTAEKGASGKRPAVCERETTPRHQPSTAP